MRLHIGDGRHDLGHALKQAAWRVHHDDEILVACDCGLGGAVDVVRRPRIDLDIEGDDQDPGGTGCGCSSHDGPFRRQRRKGENPQHQEQQRRGVGMLIHASP